MTPGIGVWPEYSARSPRLWLLPALAAAALLTLDPGLNQSLFLALNRAASLLPDSLWSDVTVLGDTLVCFCLMLLALRLHPQLAIALLLAALPATLLSHGLKDWLDVRRPYAVLGDSIHVIGPYLKAGSFPSGHTTSAFVVASICLLGMHSVKRGGAIVLLAMLVGASRVAVGAHWPADILGGILCGWLSAWLGVTLARRWALERNPRVMLGVRLALIGCGLQLLLGYESGYPLARPFEQTLALALLSAHLLPGWRLPGQSEAG